MSPVFPAADSTFYVEFAYYMRGEGIVSLEVQYLHRGRWLRRWSRHGSQVAAWLQAKVTLPAGTEMLRFVGISHNWLLGVIALDSVVAWAPAAGAWAPAAGA